MNIPTSSDIWITYLSAATTGFPAGLSYSTSSTGSNPTSITTFPITITNTNTPNNITVYFATPITISGATQYFIAGSSNIIFDG